MFVIFDFIFIRTSQFVERIEKKTEERCCRAHFKMFSSFNHIELKRKPVTVELFSHSVYFFLGPYSIASFVWFTDSQKHLFHFCNVLCFWICCFFISMVLIMICSRKIKRIKTFPYYIFLLIQKQLYFIHFIWNVNR